jgi:hypothetical protein
MIRLFSVSLGALLLAAGCGKADAPVARNDCVFEKLDLSACNRSGLGAVQTEGIWNMDLLYSDGLRSSSVISYLGEQRISGLPITSKRVEGDAFEVASEFLATDEVTPIQVLFAGCRSSSPTHVEGMFLRCFNGAQDLSGTFQAKRIQRREGESEGLGISYVAELALPEGVRAHDVFVSGGFAYVAAREKGLFIIDVSNPAAPSLAGTVKPPETEADVWHQVWVHGQTMYIATTKRGVLVYDVSNPRAPGVIKAYPSDRTADVRAVTMDGNWLYAASPNPNADILIFDATNPRELVLVKRYPVEQTNPLAGDRPYDVLAREGRLYVSHWSYGLAVADVTNPRQPKKLGNFAYKDATTRTVAVSTVGSRTIAFEAGEAWGSHLRVLDVTAPDVIITQAAEFQLRPEVSIRSLALAGTKLYVAHYQDGLRVLDVSNPSEPREVGYFNTWRETDKDRGQSFFEGISDVAVPGDGYIYAAETSRGLVILREQP